MNWLLSVPRQLLVMPTTIKRERLLHLECTGPLINFSQNQGDICRWVSIPSNTLSDYPPDDLRLDGSRQATKLS